MASETDSALALVQSLGSGRAAETDTALALAASNPLAVGMATGTNTALALTVGGAPNPDFANVVLLMGFNGTDGSTTFTDESSFARTATAGGNAQIDTAWSKSGTGSLLLDGTTDSVDLPYYTLDKDNSVAGIQAGYDVQIEGWIRFASGANLTATHEIFAQYLASGNNRVFRFHYTNGVLRLIYYADGSTLSTAVSASWSPSTLTDYHVAY